MATYTVKTSNACVWQTWTMGTTNAATDAGTVNPWGTWVTTASTGTVASYTQTVWIKWCDSGTTAQNIPVAYGSSAYQPTPAEIEAERRRADEWKKKAEEERKKRIAAEKRATRLLKRLLTSKQLAEYERRGHFHVVGESGQRYRIRKNSISGNVDVLGDDGKVQKRLCCHPDGLPVSDVLLAQKLALERDEKSFLKIANVHAA